MVIGDWRGRNQEEEKQENFFNEDIKREIRFLGQVKVCSQYWSADSPFSFIIITKLSGLFKANPGFQIYFTYKVRRRNLLFYIKSIKKFCNQSHQALRGPTL